MKSHRGRLDWTLKIEHTTNLKFILVFIFEEVVTCGCECSVTESEGGLYNACNLRLAENAMGKLFCWQRGLPSPLLAAADSLAAKGKEDEKRGEREYCRKKSRRF